ncbi:MAG: patatin-like phospholipase family protein [Candidatus Onthomorpha sp.]
MGLFFRLALGSDWVIMSWKLSEVMSSASGRGGIFAALLLCFCMLQPHATFSTPDSLRCQKVGLVLSGGGARGVAHLGVLRALEEAQIPVDYVCGTSMGAIMGALYASGYSVDEIEQIFYSEEFQYWLTGEIEDKYVWFFKKSDRSPKILSVAFDTKNNFALQLPTSIMDPVQMDYAFLEIFASATTACKGDFDSLMIPFFCVASDIEENKESVRTSGDLGLSVRASMTFPFVFSPIELDGKIMFDGGIYNNFPAKRMLETYHPDIIIGVKVAGNYPPPKEGNMRSYLENMLTTSSDYEVYCANSVLIEPNLGGTGVMEFDKMRECDRAGYDAAIEKIPLIREFLLDSISKEELAEKRAAFNAKKPPLEISAVSIQGANGKQKQYISSVMTHNESIASETSTSNIKSFKSNYVSLYLDDNIMKVQPELKYNEYFKSYIMNIKVKTNSLFKAHLGGMISTNPTNYIYAGLSYNFLSKHAFDFKTNLYLGRYYNAASLKARVDFASQHPLFMETDVNLNKWNFFRVRSGVFSYSPVNYLEQAENNARMTIGMPLGVKDKLLFTFGIGTIRDKYFKHDYGIKLGDTPDMTRFNHLAIGLKEVYSTMDDQQFPTKGNYRLLSLQFVSGKERSISNKEEGGQDIYRSEHSWFQIKMCSRTYVDITENFQLGMRADLFYSFQDLFETYKSSLLNAGVYTPTFETLTQYMPEYRANQYLAFGLGNIYSVPSLLNINLSFRYAAYIFVPFRQILSDDNARPYYGEFFQKAYFAASTSIVLRTPAGPLSLALSYHQRDDKNLNPLSLSLSFGYAIFNPRNIDK